MIRILNGRYELLEQIGFGGMAIVYKAKRISDGNICAVKIIKEEQAADLTLLRRFRTEAEAMMTLSHKNIVNVIELDSDGGLPYMVMEYVEGQTLKEMITQRKTLPFVEAAGISMQICLGLQHAHENNIIHRDIKPQNILLDSMGNVKITDFGIARQVDAETMTFQGKNVMGSVHYLSPEQAKGADVDIRTDIYALGIVLYEMVTGQVPFSGDSSMLVVLKHLQENIAPPIDVNPNIPQGLNDIIVKATMKDQSARYQSAESFKEDLQTYLINPNRAVGVLADNTISSDISDADSQAQPIVMTDMAAVQQEAVKRSRGSIFMLVSMLVLLLGIFVTVFLIGRGFINSTVNVNKITTPKFETKTEDQAYEIANRDGLKLDVILEYSDTDVMGSVMLQSPEPGTLINPGGTVQIVVSNGPAQVIVPNVINSMHSDAMLDLEELGLTPVVHTEENPDVEDGTIFGQNPLPGEEVPRNSMVELWVAGIPVESVVIPDVKGLLLKDAMVRLGEVGLQLGLVYEQSSTEDTGTVLRQVPDAEEPVVLSNAVDLYISAYEPTSFVAEVTFDITLYDIDQVQIAVLEDGGFLRVLYNATLQPGAHTLAEEIHALSPGEKDVVLLVGNNRVDRQTVEFIEETP